MNDQRTHLEIMADQKIAIHALRAQNRELLAALKAAEWGGTVAGGQLTCPVCRFGERDGHRPNCELAAAITSAKEETK